MKKVVKLRVKTLNELHKQYGEDPFESRVPRFVNDIKTNQNVIVTVRQDSNTFVVHSDRFIGYEGKHIWPVPEKTLNKYFSSDLFVNILPEDLFKL